MSGNIAEPLTGPDQLQVTDSKTLLQEFREIKKHAPDMEPVEALEWIDNWIARTKRYLEDDR